MKSLICITQSIDHSNYVICCFKYVTNDLAEIHLSHLSFWDNNKDNKYGTKQRAQTYMQKHFVMYLIKCQRSYNINMFYVYIAFSKKIANIVKCLWKLQ